MKRKERKLLFRIINAISSMVLLISCVYFYFWGLSALAVTGAIVAACCIGGPVVVAGEGALEIFVEITQTLLHAVIDAVMGIFEAIGHALSSIG